MFRHVPSGSHPRSRALRSGAPPSVGPGTSCTQRPISSGEQTRPPVQSASEVQVLGAQYGNGRSGRPRGSVASAGTGGVVPMAPRGHSISSGPGGARSADAGAATRSTRREREARIMRGSFAQAPRIRDRDRSARERALQSRSKPSRRALRRVGTSTWPSRSSGPSLVAPRRASHESGQLGPAVQWDEVSSTHMAIARRTAVGGGVNVNTATPSAAAAGST